MASRHRIPSTLPPGDFEGVDPRRVLAYAVVIAFLAGAVRWVAAGDDFWQDEIWSWIRSVKTPSATELLFVNDENNHILNSWFLVWLGPNRDWFDYRLPNVIAGTGSVLLAGWINRRHGSAAVLSGMALLGGSYLMVHYSSEARGYGLVVFFALAAYALLEATLERPSFWLDLAFGAACILGVLSQAVFVYAFAALLAWATLRRRHEIRFRSRGEAPADAGSASAAPHLWRWHTALRFGLPILFMAWLYWVNLRIRLNAGGPVLPLFGVVSQTLALTVGGPWEGWGTVASAVALAGVLAAAVWRLFRTGDDTWAFYASVLFVMPVGLLLATMRDEIYPRYFVVSMAFACVLLGRVFAVCWSKDRATRIAAVLLLAAALVGDGRHVARLVQVGRGRYFAALDDVVAATKGHEVRIGSDFDFRNRMLVGFYARMLTKPVIYYDKKDWPDEGPEWYLAHDLDPDGRFLPEVTVSGHTYALQHEYPYAGLSGWRWGVYRRLP